MANYNRRHWQHTKEYVYELNTTTNKKLQPFRMTDDIMMIGKFKGRHLSDVPEYYLKWLLNNYDGISIGAKQKIEKIIKKI